MPANYKDSTKYEKTTTHRSQEDVTTFGYFNFGVITRNFLVGALAGKTKIISKSCPISVRSWLSWEVEKARLSFTYIEQCATADGDLAHLKVHRLGALRERLQVDSHDGWWLVGWVVDEGMMMMMMPSLGLQGRASRSTLNRKWCKWAGTCAWCLLVVMVSVRELLQRNECWRVNVSRNDRQRCYVKWLRETQRWWHWLADLAEVFKWRPKGTGDTQGPI